MLFLDRVDAFIYKVCPFVAAGVVVGSIYWTAVTYGAVTVMQASIMLFGITYIFLNMGMEIELYYGGQ